MAAVRGGRGRGRGRGFLQEGEAPEAHVAEQGKKVVRELVARQTATSASLEQQRAREREREFQRAAAVLPLSCVSSGAGASSLRDFTASAERARRTEELARTLPLHDLRLLLEHEEGAEAAVRLTEPERLAREERLRIIQRKLSSAEAGATPHRGDVGAVQAGPSTSRHVQELSSALRLDGEMSPFVRLALDKVRDDAPGEGDDDAVDDVPRFREAAVPSAAHPVHRLAALERGLFGHLDPGAAGPPAPSATSRKRRRLRQAVDQPKARAAGVLPPPSSAAGGGGGVGATLWDVREAAPEAPKRPTIVASASSAAKEPRPRTEARVLGPARPRQYTVQDGKIVELDSRTARAGAVGKVEVPDRPSRGLFIPTGQGTLTLEELGKNRLAVEEIRQLPKFASYDEGSPSTVLYVKNLDGSVTEDDLAAVFGAFQTGSGTSVTFRLCGGRMRGQAFVTFPTQEDATAALSEVNGYLLKGRPMIVQYGRGQNQ